MQIVVLNNGYISKFFEPQKGVRQGCPLSCYLFILVVEILAIKVRTSNAIKGITVSKKEIKVSQLADDTSLFISNTNSIKPVLDTLGQFQNLSGLKANIEKTKFYNISATEFDDRYMQGFNFSKDKINLLGITITKDRSVSEEYNFRPRLKAMKTILKQWSRRKLSLKGKITVINALAIALIMYPTTVLDTPANILHEINSILYTFFVGWKEAKDCCKSHGKFHQIWWLKNTKYILKSKSMAAELADKSY